MRLLLDEHISPEIARSLRRGGHDVVAVAERADLRRRSDIRILVAAAAERRVVVTVDVADFTPLGSRRLPSRQPHLGVVLVPRRTFPLAKRGIGPIVRALSALLEEHPGEDELVGRVVWLKEAPTDHD